jgi:Skp family chaperone for outer membrane proteins
LRAAARRSRGIYDALAEGSGVVRTEGVKLEVFSMSSNQAGSSRVSSWRSPFAALSAAAIALAAISVVNANSKPAVVMAAPTTVGVVDLQVLVEGLNEVKAQNDALQKRAKELQDMINTVKAQFEAAKTAFEAAPASDPKKFELGVKAQSAALSLKGHQEGLQAALSLEKGRYWKILYPRIMSSIETLAAQQGLDLIMLDDRKLTLPLEKDLTDEQITGFIQSKKIMYAKQTVDVTPALVNLMNNTK